MKRTNLRRAVSGVLSFAITATTIFADFTVPASVYASDDASLETSADSTLSDYSEGSASITSEYIAQNLDEEIGEDTAALNEDAAYMVAEEYLVSVATSGNDADNADSTDADVSTEEDTVTATNDAETELISASSNDVISASSNDAETIDASSNDVGIATFSLDDEADTASESETDVADVTVSEEELTAVVTEIIDNSDDIIAADDYDDNGIAASYHYITLNYSLVDADCVWDGMTIHDIFTDCPDAFIASYLSTINVYTLDDNEDYFVAFADPAVLNGLGSGIYAEFTDGDTYDPTSYNDIITFDAETGLIYIPKSFYYNEEGTEVLKPLTAQILVPFSFDDSESEVAVSVTSEMDGVTGISGTSTVNALDVTMTFQIVDESEAGLVSIEDLYITINDDMLPFDSTTGDAYYDDETGKLTLALDANSIYAVSVTISDNIMDETLVSLATKEILVASVGDISNIISADVDASSVGDYNYATTADNMKSLTGTTIEVSGTPTRGQTFTFGAEWANNETTATMYVDGVATAYSDIVNTIIKNTATMSYYYVVNQAATYIDSSNYTSVMDASGNAATYSYNNGYYTGLIVAHSSSNINSAYNRVVQLPNGQTTTSGSTSLTWSVNISSNPSGFKDFVAMHCADSSANIAGANEGNTDVTMRVLYYDSTDNYLVFAITIPTSWQQAGSAVYKVKTKSPSIDTYSATFGINKVSSTSSSTKLNATFGYRWTSSSSFNSTIASMGTGVASSVSSSTNLTGALSAINWDGVYTSTTGSTPVKNTITSSNSDALSSYSGSGDIGLYIVELRAADGYNRRPGVWFLTITPGANDASSTIKSAKYYTYSNGTWSSSSCTISSDGTYFTATDTPITYYAKIGIQKVSSDDTSTLVSGAVYGLYTTESAANTAAATTYSSQSSAASAVSSASGVSLTSSTSTVWYTTGWTGSQYKVYYLTEVYAPSGYYRDTTVYKVTITGTTTSTGIGCKISISPSSGALSVSSSTSNGTYMIHQDTPHYYGALNLKKVSKDDTSTYVSGAAYVLIETGADISYYNYVNYATAAYEANSSSRAGALKAFYETMASTTNKSGTATLDTYIRGVYVTSTSTSGVQLKELKDDGTVGDAVVLDFGTSTRKHYVLVEVYTPSTYELDDSYYDFYLQPNGNNSTTYATALKATTMVAYGSASYGPNHSTSSSADNTWSTYATINNNSSSASIYLTVKDKPHYYGALNLNKVSTASSSTYVSGAVYALIETGADVSYTTYTGLAAEAYAKYPSDSAAAMAYFYSLMAAENNKAGTATLASYIVGAYTTTGSSTAATLKTVSSTGAITSTNKVIDFGTSTQKKFVLVEVWTPATYELDSAYYAFYLKPNGNTSTTYATAANATTMITQASASSTTYYPFHQTSYGTYQSSLDTWATYITLAGNSSSAALTLTVKDERVHYYAKIGLQKVKEGTSTLVSGAVYGLFSSKDAAEDFADTTFTQTTAQSAAAAVGYSFTTGSSTVWKTLNWYSSSATQTYYLVEMYAPTGYTRDTTVYTVTITGTKDSSGIGCSISVSPSNSSLTVASDTSNGTYMVHEETPETYYGAVNIIKKNESDSYVSGAVYALIMAGSGRSYDDYVELAQQAYESNKTDSAAAAVEFYRLMSQEYDTSNTSTLDSYIVGAYKTGTSSTGAQLKTFTASGIGSSSTVINFGSSTQKRFIMVEIWTPTGYTLDSKYYSFYLQSNENTSTTYSTAVAATTINTSLDLWHRENGGTSTWDSDVDIINNDTTAALALKITNEKANYYGALNLDKKDEDGNRVGGAVYALIEAGAGIGYSNYLSWATSAYNANKTDSEAAFKAFYTSMQNYSGGDLTGYIVGAYTTSSSGAVQLKAVNSDGTISTTSTVLDFATYTQKKYILVEVYTPTGYTLDTAYYSFYLKNNKNESATYSTALLETTMITDDSDTTYAPIHQSSGSTTNSTNTWDDYTTVSGNTLSVSLSLTVKDEKANYYGAMNLDKKDEDGNRVSGAVYALIKTGASLSYYNYVDMATAAYNANNSDSAAAFKAFYTSMQNSTAGDLTGYIAGVYTTGSSGAVELKAVDSDGTISTSSTVLDFGTNTDQKYVLVEVYTPTGYTLDDSYYVFHLQNTNKNESDTYATALLNTTMVTDTSSSYAPFHQKTGDTLNSTNTWSTYATVAGNTLSTSLSLTVKDEKTNYYGVMNLNKVSSENNSTHVKGAVYALIAAGANLSYYKYVDMATAAYNANTTDSDAAFKAFYETMENGGYSDYIMGAYITTGSSTPSELMAVTSSGTISSSSTVIDFGTATQKKFILVEIWTPDDYLLDDSYYIYYLKNNKNESDDYDTALTATTMITKNTATSTTYYNYHQSSGDKYSSAADTWDDYAILSGNTTSANLVLTVIDEKARYYGALDINKVSTDNNSTYVNGAVYALIKVGAGISYSQYVKLATEAYNANTTDSDAAFAAFYEAMANYSSGGTSIDLTRYIEGAYVTTGTSTAARLKQVTSAGVISSADAVLSFGKQSQYKYVLVEVWTPSTYVLDNSYYVFYLENNGNTSTDYDTALDATTLITQATASSSTYYPFHQPTGSTYSAYSDTWDEYVTVSGNAASEDLVLTVSNDLTRYYGAMNLEKKDDDGNAVEGAVYALIQTGANLSYYNYVDMATAAYEANKTDGDAAFEAFYETMDAGGYAGYIVGAYVTGTDAAELMAVEDGKISSSSTVLSFDTRTSRKYVLVEIYTPTGYTLDDSYYVFYLKNNGNTSAVYADALTATTMITKATAASTTTYNFHQASSSTYSSTLDTWDDYATVSGNTTTLDLVLSVKDKDATYYGAMNLEKKNVSGSYVKGAVYVLIKTGASLSYYNYVDMATAAYEANKDDSEAAVKAFYESMKNYSGGDLTGYIAGAYTTVSGAAELKAVNSDGTISSTSTVLDFGANEDQKYVLVEVYTPTGYTLDDSYYVFHLQSNKNESDTYATAVKNTTMITDSSSSYAPFHQKTGDTINTSNTWDEYAGITNGSSLTAALKLTVIDEKATYYGAMNLEKLAKNEGDYVEGAVYALIAIGSGYGSYNFVNYAHTAYDANTKDSAAAFKAFYEDMDGRYNSAETAMLSSYIVGAYITTNGAAELKAVNSDGTISSTSTVINFGANTQKKYVLVEIWTPEGYELDSAYYTFYLDNNKNESATYSEAVKATTMLTDTSNATYTPAHQASANATNTWDEYTEVTNGGILTAALKLTVKENEITTLKVVKEFDTDTEDRLHEVTVTLYQNGDKTDKTLTLNDGNSWTDTFTGLAKYDDNGDTYTYEAVETSVTYTDMYGATRTVTDTSIIDKLFSVSSVTKDGTTTITNTFQFAQRAVIKEVDPDTESRLLTVVVSLSASGRIMRTMGLSASSGWYGEFTGLDKYSYTGEEIVYTVSEMMAVYYTMDGNVATASGTTLTTLFDPETDNDYGVNTTKFTNTYQFTEHTVVKTFGTDTEDRITSITVELYRNGSATGRTATIDKASGWTYTWEDLDMYNTQGVEYTYTAVETGVIYTDMWDNTYEVTDPDVLADIFNVTSETKDTETKITNTFAYTTHTVTKEFGSDTESIVNSITAELYQNGKATGMTVVLDAASGWTYTWVDLDKYDGDGEEYDYSAVETDVNYTDEITGTVYTTDTYYDTVFTVENTSKTGETVIKNTLDTIDVNVTKTFSDNTEDRISEVVIELYRNGIATGKTLTLKTGSWTGSFTKLAKYDHDGGEYTYTAKEISVTYTDMWGTEHTVEDEGIIEKLFNTTVIDDQYTITVINTFSYTTRTVIKTFANGSYAEVYVKSVTASLYANGSAAPSKFTALTLNDANLWTDSWTGLDMYDYNGELITYTAEEATVTFTDMTGNSQTVDGSTLVKIFNPVTENDADTGITTITNNYTTTEYTVTKEFGDDTESRVESVTIALYQNGKEIGGVTLNSNDGWTYTWEDLDAFDSNGEEYTYTAAETEVQYTDDYTGTVLTTTTAYDTVFTVELTPKDGETVVKNTINTTKLTVEKTFGDDTEDRISEVVVELYRNGVQADATNPVTLTLKASDDWTGEFTNLVKYDPDGFEYLYTAKEISVTYTDMWGDEHTVTDESVMDKLFTIETTEEHGKTTIKNTFVYTQRSVTKAFVSGSLASTRIQSITTSLYANGTAAPSKFAPLTLSSANSWASYWTGLDKYDYEGNLITYTVKETTATYLDKDGNEYTVSDNALVLIFAPEVDDNHTTNGSQITNDYKTTEYTVTKEFGDNTESRVESVTVELYQNSKATGRTATLESTSGWTYTWEDLDKYDSSGNEYSYSAVETEVDYTDDYTGLVNKTTTAYDTVFTVELTPQDGETVIKNTINTTKLTVEKTFGADTEDRIKTVVVMLYRNDVATGRTLSLSESNNWTGEFTNLVKYDPDGNEYSYRAVEYVVVYTDMWGVTRGITSSTIINKLFTVETTTDNGTTTIKNTFNTVDHSVSKEMLTSLTESLVTSATMELFADGNSLESVFGNITLSDSNSWSGTWEGLDEYDYKGNLITYTADEVEVTMRDQFRTTIVDTVPESSVKTVFDVDINELSGETEVGNTVVTTSLDVEKVFGDNTEDRIKTVVVMLYRNDAATGRTLTLSESNNWSATFTNLVKYDPNGNEYSYRAVEMVVAYADMWGEVHGVTSATIINKIFTVETTTENGKTTIKNTLNTVDHGVSKEMLTSLTESLVTSVTTELFADGVSLSGVFGDITLNDTNSWSGTWENLDEYDYKGNLITYTVNEIEVTMRDQYHTATINTVSETNVNTVFNVNIYELGSETEIDNTVVTTYLDVEKVFGDRTEERISEVEVTLVRNGEKVDDTLILNAANGWTDTFEDLVKYDSDGNEYEYSAVETGVTYTDMWGDTYTVVDADVLDKLFNVTAETADGKTTITNTFEYTTRTVIKSFATPLTLSRMVEITTTLYADNVSTKEIFGDKTLNADNTWFETWDYLDEYDHEGNPITYTVKETTATYTDKNLHSGTTHTVIGDVLVTLFAPEYDDEVDETTSEIENWFQTTDFTVVKEFGDGTEGRIINIEAELYENGKSTGWTVTLDDSNDWTYTWEDLDKFDSTGVTYDYTAKEVSVTYTDMWGNDYTITDETVMKTIFDVDYDYAPKKTTITDTLKLTRYSVSKTFGSDLTESLVVNIVAELLADGNSLAGVFGNKTLDADNSWTDTWLGLDKFDHEGNLITYTAKEVSADVEDQYDATVVSTVKDALETVFDVITTTKRGETSVDNTIVTTELDVEKTFGDNTENRISEVVVTLIRNGEAVDDTLTLSEANNWADTFTDLVKYDPDGNEYEYSAVETSVTYTDMWGDSYTIVDADVLDKLFNVNAVTEDGKTTITNTFEYTERAVTKSFATDLAEKRIQGITTTLYANSTSLEAVFGDITLSDNNSWTDVWTGLDKYDYEGNRIVYTVRETTATYLDMDDTLYTVSDNALVIIFTPAVDDEVDETSTEITNDFKATEHTVVKEFGYVVSEDRVINVVAELYRNGEETGRTVVLSDENDWTYTWEQLDMYDSTGEAYEYTAVEVSVTYTDVRGDEKTITGDKLEQIFNSEAETSDKVTLLTNTLETATHAVVKTFKATAKDDVEFVTVQLYADGVAVGSEVILNDANDWTYTWSDLDEYNADGTDVVYTVKEILINGKTTPTADNGYIVTYDNTVTTITAITNDTTKLEISKTDIVTGEEVEGAKLTIYYVDELGNRTEVDSWTSTDEPHYIEKMPVGDYVLVEENTPNGYQVAEEVTFTVTDTGEVQKVEMFDDRTYGKVVVNKTDENGKPLAGVEFTITEKETGKVVDVIKTDANGYAESKEMPIDERQADQTLKLITYTIQETATVGNYTLDATVTEFEYTYVDDTTPVVTYKLGVTNELQKGRIAVMKKGIAAVGTTTTSTVYGNVEKIDYDYIYLPGVEFTIYADKDLTEVVAKITTDKNGAAYSDYLPVGTYYVVETFTPAGYVSDDTVYTVTLTGNDTGKLYVVDVTKDIVNHPCSVTINIYKEGSYLVSTQTGYEEKTEPLEGVVIGIYAAEDITNYVGTTVIHKDDLIAILVTDENGLATMTETLPAGTYYYKELKALDGYALDETKHEFSVSYDNDNATLDVNKDNPLVNYIQSGTLNIYKVDQNNNPLGAGVEFLVTCVDTGETWTLVTDANGYAGIADLAIGAYVNGTWVYYTYTLQETKTLDNYKLDDTVYTWQFTADNTNAKAVYQSFTVRNVILGIVSYNMAGGVSMLMLAFVLVLMAIMKKKELGSQVLRPTTRDEEEELETVTETAEI